MAVPARQMHGWELQAVKGSWQPACIIIYLIMSIMQLQHSSVSSQQRCLGTTSPSTKDT